MSKSKSKAAEAGHITAEGFTPSDPERYAEMRLERITYSPHTGEKQSEPFPATFNEKDWIQFLQFQDSQALSVVEILHLPAGWKKPEVITPKQ